MEVRYAKRDGELTFNVEGDMTSVFEQLSQIDEVFSEKTCGLCGAEGILFKTRVTDEDFKYFEMVCSKPGCRARLSFGQHNKGKTLFAKRKVVDENGQERYDNEHRGWAKYVPQQHQHDDSPPPPPQTQQRGRR